MRLIDADALWMTIIHAMDYCDDILEFIEKSPTIDPTKKGEWLPNPDDTAGEPFYICSQCGHGSYDITKFCPYCGSLNEEEGDQDG